MPMLWVILSHSLPDADEILPRVNPADKYDQYTPVHLADRQWPSRVITTPPTWVSTDLRDGNQALATPMTIEQKMVLFKHLVSCGFKEIEVGFPSASATEFLFLRTLIESEAIPEHVWIQVMTPARKDLISRTFDAVRGAKQVIIQLYSSTAHLFREVVYRYTKTELVQLAVDHTHFVRQLADAVHGTSFRLLYGVEGFSQSEPQFVIAACTAVRDAWNSHGRTPYRIMFNLASTVESGPANHFADQIEFFCKNMPNRSDIVVGVHTHNDRGTAVAATELALLAGAERVDGCLFGNGERTGNVDLVTLALNMYTQGIAPGLDFSHLEKSIDLITQLTNIPVHPRHPYAGDLVYTAFSGAHQDGIAKGFAAMAGRHAEAEQHGRPKRWAMPYLPADPADFGFAYAPVRVNSQSGKGGVAYVVEQMLQIDMPRPMRIAFHKVVQSICDAEGRELALDEIAVLFRRVYHYHAPGTDSSARIFLRDFHRVNAETESYPAFNWTVIVEGSSHIVSSGPHDPLRVLLDVVLSHFKRPFVVGEQETRSSALGVSTCVELADGEGAWWGVGVGRDALEAKLKAVISAVNCAIDSSTV
ncbi:hypothetical protein B0H10DRAFT_2244146 [Mycena sp. CBHHK59/15]|nr:hypothetical protein B0H10DRAFT_2244146 [Mycena sp. CBHHK59/15]